MKRQALPTLEEAFSGTLYGNSETIGGQIVEIDPSELVEIDDQPFHPYKSDKLSDLAESIRNNGQQQPCIVRKLAGQYIVLAGRNRKRACELAGCKVKCIVRECSDADADLILTETNLCQRHELLPSELAKGYKMQKSAYEAKGNRKSTAAIAAVVNENVKTIQRYIKLADLHPALLDLVDAQRIPVMAGVALTQISKPTQKLLAEYLQIHDTQCVSLAEANKLVSFPDWDCDKLSHLFAGKFESEKHLDQNYDKLSHSPERQFENDGNANAFTNREPVPEQRKDPSDSCNVKGPVKPTHPVTPAIREPVPSEEKGAAPITEKENSINQEPVPTFSKQIHQTIDTITLNLSLLRDMLEHESIDASSIDQIIKTVQHYRDDIT